MQPLITKTIRFTFALILLNFFAFLGAMENSDQKRVRLYYEANADDSYSLFGDNDRLVPTYIRIEFTKLENLTANVTLPFETVLPPGAQKVQLFVLKPSGNGPTRFAYNGINVKGDPLNTQPDVNFAYLFPFEHGKKYKAVQGFNGRFSHFGQNQYAIDFNLPEGTPVHAARGGVVCDLKEDSNQGGTSSSYNERANYIMVFHDDGTFGYYVHLKQNGALVKEGDLVKAGDLIGYSGNTGLSSGPHLHFDVRVANRLGLMHSIPILFLGWDGKSAVPQEGIWYYSFHPGMPVFPVLLGTFLRNEDYRNWLDKPKIVGDVDIRAEQIDDTMIIFVGNGTSMPVEGTVAFTLENLSSSMGNPIKVKVPAKTEVFLTILNAGKPVETYSYRANLTYKNLR